MAKRLVDLKCTMRRKELEEELFEYIKDGFIDPVFCVQCAIDSIRIETINYLIKLAVNNKFELKGKVNEDQESIF